METRRGNGSRGEWIADVLLVFLLQAAAPAFTDEAIWPQRLFDALGGQDRLLAINTVEVEARGNNYSHMYNHDADGSPEHLSDDLVTILWQPETGAFRIHTERSSYYPFVGKWDYLEAHDGRTATHTGPRDYRPGDEGDLAAPFVGAALKRLALFNPQILLAHAGNIVPAGERLIAGRHVQMLIVDAFGDSWYVSVDPATGFPYAVEVMESDGIMGEIPVRAVYGEWRDVDGIMMPFRVEQFADGVLNRREIRTRVRYNAGIVDANFRVADAEVPVEPALIKWGWRNAHWFNDRAALVRPTETRLETPVAFDEVGKGVFQLGGTSHNSLVIVGATSLVVVDAPLGPERSRSVLAALAKRWPDKPVHYLVLTHHHIDHAGGYALYIEAGAQLVVGVQTADFFARAIRRNTGRAPDILSVVDRTRLPEFDRSVEMIPVPNSHAEGMLVVYVADTDILFVTDLYSAGRTEQNPLYTDELFSALRFEGLGPLHLVGGHGRGSVPYNPAATD